MEEGFWKILRREDCGWEGARIEVLCRDDECVRVPVVPSGRVCFFLSGKNLQIKEHVVWSRPRIAVRAW